MTWGTVRVNEEAEPNIWACCVWASETLGVEFREKVGNFL